MKGFEIKDNIYRFSVNVEAEEIGLFESLWPIPHGVSLNSYLVNGEKKALIDLVCEWDSAIINIENEFQKAELDVKDIDYVVINHMEPDHTGFLRTLFKQNPSVKIVATPKAIELVKNFYHIDDESVFIPVKTGDQLDLGNGKKLTFYEIPNVHWPETMATYEESQKVLFTCDAFGSYGAIKDKIFDDECSDEEMEFFQKEMLRYYANIVASFSYFVLKAIDSIVKAGIAIDILAPSHGLIWRKDPARVISYYQRMASYSKGPAEQKICLVWSSMYGNTKRATDVIIQTLKEEDIAYEVFHLPYDHYGFSMASAFEAQGLILATPTYEYGLFPPMAHFLDILSRKHIFHKDVLTMGSYGWSGGAVKELIKDNKAGLANKMHFHQHIEFNGSPRQDNIETIKQSVRDLVKTVKEKGLPKKTGSLL